MNESTLVPWSSSSDPWQQILTYLETHIDEQSISDWLRPVSSARAADGALLLCIPNPTMRDWIDEHYRGLIDQAIVDLQLPYESVRLTIGNAMEMAAAVGTAGKVDSSVTARPWISQPMLAPDVFSAPLIPKYVFSSFVVGSSNQFAQAAATQVAKNPGRSYNPLFLYGASGLGKTHLMQAIAHSLREQYPKWRVVYLSAERFTNEMVQSLKNDSMVSFHERFRNLEALLVDDIQFLTRKERTQEEFFHTFNTLYDRQTQIVLSSDRPPKEIDEIEDRLRSRFEMGLIADIQPPDLETRQAILMKKAEAENFHLSEKVALLIANSVKSNVRELEGSLIRLIAYASLTHEEINEAMARQILNDLMSNEGRKVTVETVQRAVCEYFNLRLGELKARDNSKRVVFPRQVAMWLLREVTQLSLPEIARSFGDKHHTTVLHSINKITELREKDKDLNRTLNRLLNQLE